MKKHQASLLSFFGKPKPKPKPKKKKKRRLNNDHHDDESNHQQTVVSQEEEINMSNNNNLLQKTVVDQASSITSREEEVIDESIINYSASNDEVVEKVASATTMATMVTAASLKDDDEEVNNNDTDTTQSKESDDSSGSSNDEEDEEEVEDDDNDDSQQSPTSDTSNLSNSSNSTNSNNNNPHQKSEYELMRERNIARNNARLKALGLFVESSHLSSSKQQQRKRRTKASVVANTQVTNKAANTIIEPTRRSSRLSGVKMNYTDDSIGHVMNQQEDSYAFKDRAIDDVDVQQKEEQFKVSPLFDYQMNDAVTSSTTIDTDTTTTTSEVGGNNNVSNNGKIKSLVPLGKRLVPPAGLNAIYSLQFYNNLHGTTTTTTNTSSSWLVGAGKSGIISVWDCNNSSRTMKEEEDQISYVEPVLSWKGHGGRWIADARFLQPSPSVLDSSSSSNVQRAPSRLLTAGNDGTVCHWDLSTTSLTTGAPRLLHQTNKSLHVSGIFSMDVKAQQQQEDCWIVTGSKDKSIAVTKLSRLADGEGTTWRSQFHTAKVASVSFSSSTINPLIASASDDGFVAIHDMRQNGSSSAVASLENSHVKPHSAVWKPSSDSIFITAGLDDVIKLWDVRNTEKPVMSFHGHVPTSGKKLKRIQRPTFFTVGSDSFILSGGENSHAISMFQDDEEDNAVSNASLRSVFSRGKLPDGCGDVGSMAVHSNQVAVTVEGGEVIILTTKS